ncbi:MAG: hypothetical protein Q8P81_02040 [Nanoarchaeota archaeon]|nr:hypothetical protein [Nanoarchaeota archaeon]
MIYPKVGDLVGAVWMSKNKHNVGIVAKKNKSCLIDRGGSSKFRNEYVVYWFDVCRSGYFYDGDLFVWEKKES